MTTVTITTSTSPATATRLTPAESAGAALELVWRDVDSPLGRLRLSGHDGVLTSLIPAEAAPDVGAGDPGAFDGVAAQLDEYFAGQRTTFEVSYRLAGSAFQQSVWDALVQIPFGSALGYGELARRIGRPSAARAVGAANGRNPVAIIVPCHRVIGADRSLTGYAWGTERKAWLLRHEGILL